MRKKLFYLPAILLTLAGFLPGGLVSNSPPSALAAAPPPELHWSQTFGGTNDDVGTFVQPTADGGYIIVGDRDSLGDGFYDIYLIKTNASGNMTWSQTIGGASDDYANSVQQTADGGYIVVGFTYSFFGGSNGDVYLVKTDASGNITWHKTFGGTKNDFGYSVLQTADGGYIITGRTASFGAGLFDVYLIKTDASGNMTWSKTFGGAGSDMGYSVYQTVDSGYIIAGSSNSSGAGGRDAYLIKTDASGNMTWSKTFGGAGDDYARTVRPTADCGYIISGSTNSSGAGGQDAYLIKTDASGDMNWSQTFGGANDDYGGSVQPTADGGYIIGGSTNSSGAGLSDVYLVKTDASGNITWSQTFGGAGDDTGLSVLTTPDGGYIIVGSTDSSGAGLFDVLLIKVLSPLVAQPPTLATGNATNITSNSARLHGTLTSMGTSVTANASFQWGPNSGNYTYETSQASMNTTGPFSYVLNGLSANITYHFRAKVVGDNTTFGGDNSFTTASVPTGVQVTISAPPKVAADRNFTAVVNISQVQNFDGDSYDISFNPAVLRLDTVTGGYIGGIAVPVDMWNPREPGRFSIIGNIPGLAGATGSGFLAQLHFHVIGSLGQSSTITISGGVLSNTDAANIPATWIGDFVEVAIIPGDVNGDGSVNAIDVTKLERIIAHLDSQTPGADANLDGMVNALDITQVERITVGLD